MSSQAKENHCNLLPYPEPDKPASLWFTTVLGARQKGITVIDCHLLQQAKHSHTCNLLHVPHPEPDKQESLQFTHPSQGRRPRINMFYHRIPSKANKDDLILLPHLHVGEQKVMPVCAKKWCYWSPWHSLIRSLTHSLHQRRASSQTLLDKPWLLITTFRGRLWPIVATEGCGIPGHTLSNPGRTSRVLRSRMFYCSILWICTYFWYRIMWLWIHV